MTAAIGHEEDASARAQTDGKRRAIVAMSGGVDSSAAAYLLMRQGFDVMGATLKLRDDADVPDMGSGSEKPTANAASLGGSAQEPDAAAPNLGSGTCCSSSDIEDARSVALALGFPFHVFNYTGSFKEQVIDAFCASYLRGETPNPCIDCNRYIKFAALHEKRRELGYDYLATGHYARIAFDEASGRWQLLRGIDAAKDQSYVLYSLTQDELAHTLFPLGELDKAAVRDLARKAGLANADKHESQDICFIPDGDYSAFIFRQTGKRLEPGPIVNMEGTVLGEHKGLEHYTIGQRKGIGIAAAEPLVVCAKGMDTNTLVVGTKSQATCTSVSVRNVNWISIASLDEPMRVQVKTFYRQEPQLATIRNDGMAHGVVVEFEQPIRRCANGQAAVFYDGERVVGGGTIAGC